VVAANTNAIPPTPTRRFDRPFFAKSFVDTPPGLRERGPMAALRVGEGVARRRNGLRDVCNRDACFFSRDDGNWFDDGSGCVSEKV
jgi:hypothetical protein